MNNKPLYRPIEILLIEDNPADARLVKELLSETANVRKECGRRFNLEYTDRLSLGLERLAKGGIDVVLLDLALPDCSGLETFRRAHAQAPHVPTIILSGLSDEALAMSAVREGAQDYLLKGQVDSQLLGRSILYAIERQRAEAALQQSQRLFEAVVETAPMLVVLIHTQGRILFFNKACEELTGFKRDEVLGKSLVDFLLPPEWQSIVQNRFKDPRSPELRKPHENPWLTKSGQERLIVWRCTMLPTGQHGSSYMLGIGIDITESKASEERIREQASLLDLAHDAIAVRDLDDRIVFWNKGAEDLYGWTSSEVIGKDITEFIYTDPAELIIAKQELLTKGTWNGVLHQKAKSGNELIVSSRWTLLLDENKKPKSILIINTDITEKRALETQFLRAQRLESVGRLASGIAHDLNNILTPILIGLSILKEESKDKHDLELLHTMETSAQRGAQIIKQLLTFARGIEGQRTPVNLELIVKELARIIRETFPKSINLTIETAPDLRLVIVDPTQLYQVLLNLCVNARDAMPNGGSLVVSAANIQIDETFASMTPGAKACQHVMLEVRDTGIGIAQKDLDRIFDPFFTTKSSDQASGLGLSTTLGIVKSHNGFIQVNSRPNHGACFRVFIPALEEAAGDTVQSARQKLRRGQGELLLVVDDEPGIRDTAKKMLESNGYKVVTAANGAEAVMLYVKHRDEIKLVITDILMPVMNGAATIRALQKIDPQLKIIIFSGLDPAQELDRVSVSGGFRVLFKPFATEALLATVQQCLEAESTAVDADPNPLKVNS